jgi:RNA polymerase sigma factor (sigma-70 family)
VEGRSLDDGELVELARHGDVDAYTELVTRHRGLAVRVAYVLAGDDAEDAAQDAFVKAYQALDRFRPGAPFRPWLLHIVANEARNRRRSAGRQADLAVRTAPAGAATEAPSAEEAALHHQRREAVLRAVAALDERDRMVVACRYLAGLSEAETAAALGCRPGTVKSRLSRALARLRRQLGAELEVAGA